MQVQGFFWTTDEEEFVLGLEGFNVAGRVYTITHSGVQMHEQLNYDECSFAHTHIHAHTEWNSLLDDANVYCLEMILR